MLPAPLRRSWVTRGRTWLVLGRESSPRPWAGEDRGRRRAPRAAARGGPARSALGAGVGGRGWATARQERLCSSPAASGWWLVVSIAGFVQERRVATESSRPWVTASVAAGSVAGSAAGASAVCTRVYPQDVKERSAGMTRPPTVTGKGGRTVGPCLDCSNTGHEKLSR